VLTNSETVHRITKNMDKNPNDIDIMSVALTTFLTRMSVAAMSIIEHDIVMTFIVWCTMFVSMVTLQEIRSRTGRV
jgi:hypothetical protein